VDEAAAGIMNRRTVLILLVVFAALAFITYWQSRPQEVVPASDEGAYRILGEVLNMTVLDIQAIRLRDPATDQSFTISRDPDGMWTAPDSEGSLDTETASNIAKTVVLLPYQRTLPLTEDAALSEYGYTPDAQLSIEVLMRNGDQHAIAVGGLTPTGLTYYVLADERAELFLIERGAIDYLENQLETPPLTQTS
jgi:hypothetical protein